MSNKEKLSILGKEINTKKLAGVSLIIVGLSMLVKKNWAGLIAVAGGGLLLRDKGK